MIVEKNTYFGYNSSSIADNRYHLSLFHLIGGKGENTKMKRLNVSQTTVLILLVAVMSVVGVFMNLFTSLRWLGAPGLTFGNVFFTWIPMLVADILIEVYGKRKGFAIPAFIYLLQGLFFLVAVLLVSWHPDFLIWRTTSDGAEIFPIVFGDTFRIWFGSVFANYAGFMTNSIIMYLLKKHMPQSGTSAALLFRAVASSFFGQFVDNALFMSVGLGMWDWTSLGFRQLTEVGMEIVFFPLTLLLVRKIPTLPEFISHDGTILPATK